MKSKLFFLSFLITILNFSCTDDITDMGSGIQPAGDKIVVYADAFYPSSENYFINSFTSRPDSFLLGTYYDKKFGTTHADIFAQVQPPLGFSYPKGSVADSAYILLYYTSWFGNKYAPMEVSIYEMNKSTFEYTKPYPSDINPADYCDMSLLLKKRIFSAKDAVLIRKDPTLIQFKLSDDFVKRRFAAVMKTTYTKNTDFLNFFKGLYITTDFGSASMLYINQIDMKYYFNYKYATGNGTDSTTVNSYVTYPANPEVRQVNRIYHPDKDLIRQKLDSRPEVTFVSSPANVYTRVKLPLKSMKEKMNVGSKKLTINSVLSKFYVEDFTEDTVDHKIVNKLMMIKESAFNRFFSKKELPSDTCAIIGSFTYEKDNANLLSYYYSFDLAKFIAAEFKTSTTNNTVLPDNMNLLLVPVSVSYDSSGKILEVKQQNLMNSVTLCSGKHPTKPIRLNVVYSGF
ncbi:MAG: DUF4270 domain-containing protein [Paludibacter sp.]|nr:DUF4270 domain-containing protein [Paludibacter sp.]